MKEKKCVCKVRLSNNNGTAGAIYGADVRLNG